MQWMIAMRGAALSRRSLQQQLLLLQPQLLQMWAKLLLVVAMRSLCHRSRNLKNLTT